MLYDLYVLGWPLGAGLGCRRAHIEETVLTNSAFGRNTTCPTETVSYVDSKEGVEREKRTGALRTSQQKLQARRVCIQLQKPPEPAGDARRIVRAVDKKHCVLQIRSL